jgi:hypothetical protein
MCQGDFWCFIRTVNLKVYPTLTAVLWGGECLFTGRLKPALFLQFFQFTECTVQFSVHNRLDLRCSHVALLLCVIVMHVHTYILWIYTYRHRQTAFIHSYTHSLHIPLIYISVNLPVKYTKDTQLQSYDITETSNCFTQNYIIFLSTFCVSLI